MHKNNKAFTLVELSIVLVIIGLLTAGIVGGQSLIESSKKQRIISEMNNFDTAIKAFGLEYDARPGDMKNATDYWGTASGGCPDGTRTGTQTCNGDNTGTIDGSEKWLVWQHLALASILSGNFTGRPDSSSGSTPGENMPKSANGTGGYEVQYFGGLFGKTSTFVKLARKSASPSTGLNNADLNGKQASDIDRKVDDGRPNSGMYVAIDGSDVGGCVTGGVSTSSTTSTYILTSTSPGCRFYKWLEI